MSARHDGGSTPGPEARTRCESSARLDGVRVEGRRHGGVHGIERRHLEPAHGPGTECGRFAWALGHSKNAVFAQLATRLLTREALLKTAERLGFNAKLQLDDGDQQAEVGKLTVPYNDLEFARAAAGFQGSSLSPVGAAYLMTLIARGGEPVALRLHDAVPGASGAGSIFMSPRLEFPTVIARPR